MDSTYHSGELKVQTRVGAVQAAKNISRIIHPVIAHVFVDFIQSQPMVILGSVDPNGLAWASVLCGQPGFMTVMDEQTLRINALPDDTDPLRESLQDNNQLGLLIIDFSTQRRLRINGKVVLGGDGLSLRTQQVYSNCPRYIQARTCELRDDASLPSPVTKQAATLSEELQQWIKKADTFFISSFHPHGGADASHRGGFPGFVQVVDEQTVLWPEYNGNGMFNTLGNITENPEAGLLFIDFEQGGTLQLSGTAQIIWDEARAALFPGAERLVQFKIRKAIKRENVTVLRWELVDYSPDNPWF